MVQIDKRIVGLALVSVILSTLIMLTIAGERVEEPVEILKNEYPKILTGRKSTFSFAMVSRKRFENVELMFSMMTTKSLKVKDMIDSRKEYNATDSPDEVLENIVKFSWLKNQTSLLEIEPEKFEREITFQGIGGRMVIYDYTSILASLSGEDIAVEVPLTYCAIIDENGNDYYFEGKSDFFYKPELNMISLTTSHNDNESSYLPEDQAWGDVKLPMSTAPKGILEYHSVEKDDTFSVIYTVEMTNTPSGFGGPVKEGEMDLAMVQMIRAYLDGELFDEPILNLIRPR